MTSIEQFIQAAEDGNKEGGGITVIIWVSYLNIFVIINNQYDVINILRRRLRHLESYVVILNYSI